MITTVTLSPCIDKTIFLDKFSLDRINRADSRRYDGGGKGINVSAALSALGVSSRAVGLNFEGGELIERTLEGAGVSYEFVQCQGRIRTNLKIYVRDTKETIEINEQNPEVSQKNIVKLFDICERLAKDKENDIFVLSGSVPPAVPDSIYRDLAKKIKGVNHKAKIILDASGEPLKKGLEASPYLIKPNFEELETAFGVKIVSEEDAIALCREIIAKYSVGIALVSMDSRGALAVTKGEVIRQAALNVIPKSTQGAGDAMVAGACFAIKRGLSASDIIRCGTCAAAGSVERDGTAFCTRERFEELYAAL